MCATVPYFFVGVPTVCTCTKWRPCVGLWHSGVQVDASTTASGGPKEMSTHHDSDARAPQQRGMHVSWRTMGLTQTLVATGS